MPSNKSDKFDISKLARGNNQTENDIDVIFDEGQDLTALTPHEIPESYATMENPDMVWIKATRGLQSNLLQSLQNYKATFAERRVLTTQRKRMLDEVTQHYVNYLREEARLSTDVALKAKRAILKQELAKLYAELFSELAEITGAAVVQIEQIFENYVSKMTSPEIKQLYARFVMEKITTLLEQQG